MDLNYVEFTRHSPVDSVIVTKIMSEEISRDKDFFYKSNAKSPVRNNTSGLVMNLAILNILEFP